MLQSWANLPQKPCSSATLPRCLTSGSLFVFVVLAQLITSSPAGRTRTSARGFGEEGPVIKSTVCTFVLCRRLPAACPRLYSERARKGQRRC